MGCVKYFIGELIPPNSSPEKSSADKAIYDCIQLTSGQIGEHICKGEQDLEDYEGAKSNQQLLPLHSEVIYLPNPQYSATRMRLDTFILLYF